MAKQPKQYTPEQQARLAEIQKEFNIELDEFGAIANEPFRLVRIYKQQQPGRYGIKTFHSTVMGVTEAEQISAELLVAAKCTRQLNDMLVMDSYEPVEGDYVPEPEYKQ